MIQPKIFNPMRRLVHHYRILVKMVFALIAMVVSPLIFILIISKSSADARTTSSGELCEVEPLTSWSEQEKIAWSFICQGKPINFNEIAEYGGEIDPKVKDNWQANRVLSENFLRTILLKEPYRSALSNRGVRIIGAWFKDSVDLSNAKINHDLWLENCRFSAPLNFFQAKLSQSLSFDYSYFDESVNLATIRISGVLSIAGGQFNKTFDLTDADISSTVLLAKGAIFKDGVSLSNSKIGSELYILETRFEGPVNMISMDVDGDVIFENDDFAQRVDISLSKFDKRFYLRDSTFSGDFDLRSITTEAGLYFTQANAEKDVILSSSLINGDFRIENSTFSKDLYLQRAYVGGELILTNNLSNGKVYSANLSVKNQIEIKQNRFKDNVLMQAVKSGGSVFFHKNVFNTDLYFNSAKITEQIELFDTEIKGFLNFDSTEIKTHLLIRKSLFQGETSMNHALLGGLLEIESSELHNKLKAESISISSMLLNDSIFRDEIHLAHAQLSESLVIKNVIFHKLVYLGSVKTGKVSDISNTEFLGPISMSSSKLGARLTIINNKFFDEFIFTDAVINDGLYIRNTVFNKDFDLDRTVIEGNLVITEKSNFQSRLDLEDVVISHNLFLDGNIVLEKEFNATGIKCGGGFEIADALLKGPVKIEYASVGGTMVLGANSVFEESVSVGESKIRQQLNMENATFKKELNMEGINAGKVFLGNKAVFNGEVSLAIAEIEKELSASQSLFKGIVGLVGIKIGQNLVLGDNAIFEMPILLNSGQIAGGVIMPDSRVNYIDFSSSTIDGLLNLGEDREDDPEWQADGGIDLRNAKLGALQVPMNWNLKINLEGLVYGHLGGDVISEKPMLTREAKWYTDFLSRQINYSPQPYKYLAEKLKENGQFEKADKILYASRNRERKNSGFIRWVWLTIQKFLIGYGIGNYIFYVCYWIILFISIGTIIIYKSELRKKEGRGVIWAIFFSLDRLLPIITLDKEHENVVLSGVAKYYFYMHIFAGYVLALFLVAGISGLTKQ